jgi:hypothetical protein
LRFSIIGHLLATPPGAGELRRALSELAAKSWRHPLTGLPVRFGFSTLERWFYTVRAHSDPVAVLRNRPRADAGRPRTLSPTAIAAIAQQYQAHPQWTFQLHYDKPGGGPGRRAGSAGRSSLKPVPDRFQLPPRHYFACGGPGRPRSTHSSDIKAVT